MFRVTSLLLGAALAAGCSTSAQVDNPFAGGGGGNEAEMAAFAASSEFPADVEASDDLRATVLVNRNDRTIQVINASNQAIRDARIWINGSFVGRLDNLPANGAVTLPMDAFYDRTGTRLSDVQAGANRVQLQSGDTLYNLQGPVFE
jgi:hypothetical protein